MSTVKSFKDWVLNDLKPQLHDTLEYYIEGLEIDEDLQKEYDFIEKHLNKDKKEVFVFVPVTKADSDFQKPEFALYPPFNKKTVEQIMPYLKTLRKIDSLTNRVYEGTIDIVCYIDDNFAHKPKIISSYCDAYDSPLTLYMNKEDLISEDVLYRAYPDLKRAVDKDPINGFKEWSRINSAYKKYF